MTVARLLTMACTCCIAAALFLLQPGSEASRAGSADPLDHHTADGRFRNTNPDFAAPAFGDKWDFVFRQLWSTTFQPRTIHLPTAENDGRRLRSNHSDATVTWIGHSTLLIQLDSINLLTDPQWSDRASPVGFSGPQRVMPPGLRFEDLPPIHAVLISHDHYDHLDIETVKRLHAAHHPRFFVPLGLKAWLGEIGIEDVTELDWWDDQTFQGLKLVCLPAQHFSGRTLWDTNRRLWGGWAVIGHDRRFLFLGDTGYYGVFQEIGRRFGPFDLAAIPIGAYMPHAVMRLTHLTPEEAIRVFGDVKTRRMVAIHWGTFDLTEEPLEEPPQRLATEAQRLHLEADRIWVLKHGETRNW